MQADKWFHDKHYWLVEEEEHVWHDGSYHKPRQIEEEENAAHLFLYLVEQGFELSGLHEFGDIIVRVKTLASGLYALADFDGNRGSNVLVRWVHGALIIMISKPYYQCFHRAPSARTQCTRGLRGIG